MTSIQELRYDARLKFSLPVSTLLLLASVITHAQKPELIVQTGIPINLGIYLQPRWQYPGDYGLENTIKLWDVATVNRSAHSPDISTSSTVSPSLPTENLSQWSRDNTINYGR